MATVFDDVARVHVPLGLQSYDITIGEGLHDGLAELLPARPGQRGCIITSDRLVGLYGHRASESLTAGGWTLDILQMPDGEAAKTLATAGRLCRELATAGVDRGSVIFALGGGVVGDLAGFVAAIYLRGIAFVQLPTTLLAQVDASVGGKVAVDLPEGKNLVGAFHQPVAVIIDTATVRTLPDRHLRSGMAEVIKHAVIADAELFSYVEANLDGIWDRDAGALQHLLTRNCQIKTEIVTQDPQDTGVRSLLNLGHTVGHAVEAAAGDWAIHHGEAVALGMLAEGRLAVELGLCAETDLERLERLVERLGLQIDLASVSPERARAALRRDKKISAGMLRLPLMCAIGQARIVRDVRLEQLDAVLCNTLRKCVQN